MLSSWAKFGKIGAGESHDDRSSRIDESDESDEAVEAMVENDEESAGGASGLLALDGEPSKGVGIDGQARGDTGWNTGLGKYLCQLS